VPNVSWPPPLGQQPPVSALATAANTARVLNPPTASDRIALLLRELSTLRRQFIVVRQPPVYTDAEFARARAFVVLSHGAIEDYLEGIALEVVDKGIQAFRSDGRARTSLLALLGYGIKVDVPSSFSGGPWGMRTLLNDSRKVLRSWTEANNGVKAKDVLRLLLPVGVKETDMGNVWLQHMDDLGGLRGRVAHHGNPPGAQAPVDPQDALDHVARVLPTLCRLDARMCALRDE